MQRQQPRVKQLKRYGVMATKIRRVLTERAARLMQAERPHG